MIGALRLVVLAFFAAVRPADASAPAGSRAPEPAARSALVVEEGALVDAVLDGAPARLFLQTGFFDMLTLNPAYIAARGWKPDAFGRSTVRLGGVRVFSGRSRRLDLEIGGVRMRSRAVWFDGAPDAPRDGTLGPFAPAQEVVEVRLNGARTQTTPQTFPLSGSLETGARFPLRLGEATAGVSIAVERRAPLPIASAAAGAALAKLYGGVLEGDPWTEEIAMGVERPMRRLVLARPVAVGPFQFQAFAVRVRDRKDGMGTGGDIPDADVDPAEIVVAAPVKNAKPPVYTISLSRTQLDGCASVAFDKAARQIILTC